MALYPGSRAITREYRYATEQHTARNAEIFDRQNQLKIDVTCGNMGRG